MHIALTVLAAILAVSIGARASGQENRMPGTFASPAACGHRAEEQTARAEPKAEVRKDQGDEQAAGFPLPDTDRLRIRVDLLAGYGQDGANAALGFEKQGRIGYAIVTLEGRLHDRMSYRLAVNPVSETEPVPACGEAGFFYPNDPTWLYGAGPNVPCDPKNGNRRVDAYRGIAWDAVSQQGPIREAWFDFRVARGFTARFGRVLMPVGFDWQHSGSFTAKDAPRIQRINAQSSFGMLLSYVKRTTGRTAPLFSARLGGFTGGGNRWQDYDYFYFQDGSLSTNSVLSALVSGSFSPADSIEIRASYKKAYTGSKVERLPSYWASKRNDDSLVLGAEYTPFRYARVVGELARYSWGPTSTSAAMLGVDPSPIRKTGYWLTGEAWHPLSRNLTLGGSVSREEVGREDSLVKLMEKLGLYRVTAGKKDRMTVGRLYADLPGGVRLGFYRTWDSNPYPWLSGIWPVAGARAFAGGSTDKWGVVLNMRLR